MKNFIYILLACSILFSCERRDLTYDYSPYCEVVVNLDWSNMSVAPTGMTVMAFPDSGAEPAVIQTNTISGATLKLPAGSYNLLIFNQIPSDFGTVNFRGLDKWETAEVCAKEITTASWAASKSETSLVREPEVVAAATYTDVVITQEQIYTSTEQYRLTGERMVATTLDLKPKIVVKRTHVRVEVEGVYNLRSTRAVLTGMADGYNFASQKSCTGSVSHVLEDWSVKDFEYGELIGETYTYFMSFGLPAVTTTTRVLDDWKGSIALQMLLVDNETVIEHTADIFNYTTVAEEGADLETDSDIAVDVDIETTIVVKVGLSGSDDDPKPVLPDVKPEGAENSGFGATVEDWGDEESVDMPI